MTGVPAPLRALFALAALALGMVPVAALADVPDEADIEALTIAVRTTDYRSDGTSHIVVGVGGDQKPDVLGADAFAITENGEEMPAVRVVPAFEDDDTRVITTLVLDVSTSMAGQAMEDMKISAAEVARDLVDDGLEVGLLAFETEVHVLSEPTNDAEALVEEIEQLQPTGRTALYDAVIDGVAQVAAVEDAASSVIVFSDGEDTTSVNSFDDAIAAATEAELPVYTVAFETDDFNPDVIAPLAEETGGQLFATVDTAEFGALFGDVRAEIASQYTLTYGSADAVSETLDVEVSVVAGDHTATTRFTLPNPRLADEIDEVDEVEHGAEDDAAEALPIRIGGPAGPLATQVALIAGLVAAFVALTLLFSLAFTPGRSRGDRVLGQQLATALDRGQGRRARGTSPGTQFRERALAMIEASPRPKGVDAQLARHLEQAGWQLRNGEFLALSLGGAVIAGSFVALTTNIVGGILIGLIAGLAPLAILQRRRSKRRDEFLRSLPDTLQLLAGSLRAGYGILQAVDTVAKEASGPTAEEFQRVMTEARLGMPVEEALEAMADRVDSDDFRWVVLAINIQREVGGNLAELLDTVSETLREREALRRQIKVLSAEGRLSAAVLIALPIVLTLYLILTRPEYISTLVTSGPIGWLMVIGATTLMGAGVLWIQRMIKIEV